MPEVESIKRSSIDTVVLGGFLGAGKTTLLRSVARRLTHRGTPVALIANDQAENLVDSRHFASDGFNVAEVAGGCFCCRFDELVKRFQELRDRFYPEVMLAEPVGSCTDIAATVLRPLAQLHGAEFSVKRYSVLIDGPAVYRELTDAPGASFSEDVRYVMAKQLEEAEILVVSKIDALDGDALAAVKGELAERWPGKVIVGVSAQSGEGVDGWLNLVLQNSANAASVDVDYQRYGAGEAELGWLNATVEIRGSHGANDWRALCARLLSNLEGACRERGAAIGHIKLWLTGIGGSLAGNVTDAGCDPYISGQLADTVRNAELTLNARVVQKPAELERMVCDALAAAAGDSMNCEVLALDAFSPAQPEPTHRLE